MQSVELSLQKTIRLCSLERSGKPNQDDYFFIKKKLEALQKKVRAEVRNQTEFERKLSESIAEHVNLELREVHDRVKNSKHISQREISQINSQLQAIYKDITGIPTFAEVHNGDELKNINNYEYLRYIADEIPFDLTKKHPGLLHTWTLATAPYSANVSYGNLYTKFLYEVERLIESGEIDKDRKKLTDRMNVIDNEILAANKNKNNKAFAKKIFELKNKRSLLEQELKTHDATPKPHDEMITRIYNNSNLALERSHQTIVPVLANVKQTSSTVESAVRTQLKGGNSFRSFFNYLFGFDDINDTTPQNLGSLTQEIWTAISPNFKPQFTTGQPVVKEYQYKEHGYHGEQLPRELHFCTQGQFVNYNARVNPVFTEFLRIQKRHHAEKKITHVYFNHLPKERKPFLDFWPFNLMPKSRESFLTNVLEKLSNDEHSNIAVITLPSDQGLMNKSLLAKRDCTIDKTAAFNEILAIAKGKSTAEIKDFHIPQHIKDEIYKDTTEDKELRRLLTLSFDKLGLTDAKKISPADQQAVLFHYMKFELTNYVLEQINPSTFGMVCKFAIDRGGIGSAYYNLMKSIERGNPFSKAEFERALHAAPTLAKGRGMNHYSKVIWNVIDAYIAGQDKAAKANHTEATIPNWLRTWHYQHAIKGSHAYHVRKLEKYVLNTHKSSTGFFYSTVDKTRDDLKAKALLDIYKPIYQPFSHTNKPAAFTYSKQAVANLPGKLKNIITNLKNDQKDDLVLQPENNQPPKFK